MIMPRVYHKNISIPADINDWLHTMTIYPREMSINARICAILRERKEAGEKADKRKGVYRI